MAGSRSHEKTTTTTKLLLLLYTTRSSKPSSSSYLSLLLSISFFVAQKAAAAAAANLLLLLLLGCEIAHESHRAINQHFFPPQKNFLTLTDCQGRSRGRTQGTRTPFSSNCHLVRFARHLLCLSFHVDGRNLIPSSQMLLLLPPAIKWRLE